MLTTVGLVQRRAGLLLNRGAASFVCARQGKYSLAYSYAKYGFLAWLFCLSAAFLVPAYCDEAGAGQSDIKEPPKYAGAFFNVPVPMDNYYFIKGVLAVFGNKFGPQPQDAKQLEEAVWDQLLLSYEAFRRGVTVDPQEVDAEIDKILKTDKVDFDRSSNREAYEKWVKEKTNASATLFENQLRHLLQIQKLHEQVMAGIEPAVSRDEAYREFLNEHNSLSVELVQFDERGKADAFYKQAKKDPGFWDGQKAKNPADFKQPGFVSLEFLMDIWRFPRKDAYAMMRVKAGQIYPPALIYKGYGVFKVLSTRPANPSEFKRFEDSYFEQIRARKKAGALQAWFENLKRQANIVVYEEGRANG